MATTSQTSAADATDGWRDALSDHRLRTAERIALVAVGIIDRDGIAGLSMSRLADAAGISRQTLYKYFPDVDAVLEGIAALGGAGVAELGRMVDAQPDARAALHVFVASVLAAAEAGHPSPMALVAAVPAASREVVRGHEQAAEAIVIGIVRRGQDEGLFRADADPELDGRLIYRTTFAAHELAAEPGAEVAALARHVTDDLLRMLGAAPPHPAEGA
jgi:AcrR family transcriptional regulator